MDLQISFFFHNNATSTSPEQAGEEEEQRGRKIKELERDSGAEAGCTPDEWIAMDGDGGKNNERQRNN